MKRITGILLALLAFSSHSAMAQTYPTKPIRIVVPYQAGQGTDVATRYLAEHLGRALGQPLVVENRAGAGGNIGAAEAARAAPDGYTLLMGTNGTHVLNQFLYPSMPFDPVKDFEPVALVSTFPMVILANPNAPYKNMADLLADAKARPDAVNVGLPSTTSRLVQELIQKQSGALMRAVPYKGSGTSMTDLMGGQVLVAIDTASAARPFVASGKLKALAVTSSRSRRFCRVSSPQRPRGWRDSRWSLGTGSMRLVGRLPPLFRSSTQRLQRSWHCPRRGSVSWNSVTKLRAARPTAWTASPAASATSGVL